VPGVETVAEFKSEEESSASSDLLMAEETGL